MLIRFGSRRSILTSRTQGSASTLRVAAPGPPEDVLPGEHRRHVLIWSSPIEANALHIDAGDSEHIGMGEPLDYPSLPP